MRKCIAGVLDWRGSYLQISGVSRAATAAGITPSSIVRSRSRIWEFNEPDQAAVIMRNFETAKSKGSATFSVESRVKGVVESWDVRLIRVPKAKLVLVHAVELHRPPPVAEADAQVLAWLSKGLQPDSIARKLRQKTNSVHQRIIRLRKKLDAPTTPALVAMAIRYGIIE